MEVLQKHYDPKPSVIVQRYRFNTRNRLTGETIASYTGVEEAILHWSGKSFKHELYMYGKQDHLQNLENLVYECTGPVPIVQSTISMQSMLMLGGLGACPPRKILKNRCSEIKFRSISGY